MGRRAKRGTRTTCYLLLSLRASPWPQHAIARRPMEAYEAQDSRKCRLSQTKHLFLFCLHMRVCARRPFPMRQARWASLARRRYRMYVCRRYVRYSTRTPPSARAIESQTGSLNKHRAPTPTPTPSCKWLLQAAAAGQHGEHG